MTASSGSTPRWKWIVHAKHALVFMISAVLLAIAIVSCYVWREQMQKRLTVAVQHGDTARVRELLTIGLNPNWVYVSGCIDCGLGFKYPAICSARKPEIFKLLIEHGANVNSQCGEYTPLLEVVVGCVDWESGCVEPVQTLLEYGADPEARNSEGKSAISVASEMAKHDNRYQMIVKLLSDSKYSAQRPSWWRRLLHQEGLGA